jgi:HAD superfamily hydrolase (TIGR01509 family)
VATQRAAATSGLRPPPLTKAAIFDWDGTLADSADLNFHALRHAFQQQDAIVTQAWFTEHAGLSIEDAIASKEREIGKSFDARSLVQTRDVYVLAHLDEISPQRSVLAIALHLHDLMPIAVATGNHRRLVEPAMDAMGLSQLFGVLITRDDVAAGKPAPDLFLAAADALDVEPAHVHVYEDTVEGLAAAAAAGMTSTDVRPFLAAGNP